MIPTARPLLDERTALEFFEEILERRGGFVPEWLRSALSLEKGRDIAIAQIAARYLQTIVQRLNQVPDKNKLAFLDLLGINLIAAQAARAPLVFRLSDKAPDTRLPEGTRVAAPPPPERRAGEVLRPGTASERASRSAPSCSWECRRLWSRDRRRVALPPPISTPLSESQGRSWSPAKCNPGAGR